MRLSLMQKRTRRCVMVAIGDLAQTPEALLRKAAALAKAHDSVLRLVHVIAFPYGSVMGAGAQLRQVVAQLVQDARKRLRRMADSRALRGVPTSSDAIWDYPVSDALVRHVLKHKPEFLMLESHRHGRLARVLLNNTDWDLIRNCPCPVWFSRRTTALRGKVVAAIDPLHAHAKPANVDRIIVRSAVAAASGDVNRVLVLHAYSLVPDQAVIDGVVEAYWLSSSATALRTHRERLLRAIDRELRSLDIPTANRLVIAGDRISQLPRIVKRYRACLLVMGAVSRSGLGRLFIGNTAERVIDAVGCDVLIVKPRGFRTPVSRRPHLPMPHLA